MNNESESHASSATIKNDYEPRSHMRTLTGVLSSLLFMGLPIGLTELLRGGGDIKVAIWGFVATIIATVLAIFSIRGAMAEDK